MNTLCAIWPMVMSTTTPLRPIQVGTTVMKKYAKTE